METKLAKRLLQPTHPNHTSIKCEIEVCKVLLSQIQPVCHSLKQQNTQLKQKLTLLEWNYARQLSRKQQIQATSKTNSYFSLCPTQMKQEIEKMVTEINNFRIKADVLQKKVADRQQLLIQDEQYWRNLTVEKQRREKQLNSIKAQNEKLLKKKEKIEFLRKEMLRNQSTDFQSFDSISRQKANVKEKLIQKFHNLQSKLSSIQNKRDKQKRNLAKSQQQQEKLHNEVKITQRKLQKVEQQKGNQLIKINKIKRDLAEEENFRFELKQKLKIHQQRLNSMKELNKKLEKSKQQIEDQSQQLLQMLSQVRSQIRKMESVSDLETEHIFRILSIQ